MAMERFFNPQEGIHFFTSNPAKETLGGYRGEGKAFNLYADSNLAEGATDVFRLFNPQSGDHLFTTSKEEADAASAGGYRSEGVAGEAYKERRDNTEAVERYYNPTTGGHLLTSDPEEQKTLGSLGYNYEGTAFYAPGQARESNKPAESQPNVVEQYWQAANNPPETKQNEPENWQGSYAFGGYDGNEPIYYAAYGD